jgi:hypothetical protein
MIATSHGDWTYCKPCFDSFPGETFKADDEE